MPWKPTPKPGCWPGTGAVWLGLSPAMPSPLYTPRPATPATPRVSICRRVILGNIIAPPERSFFSATRPRPERLRMEGATGRQRGRHPGNIQATLRHTRPGRDAPAELPQRVGRAARPETINHPVRPEQDDVAPVLHPEPPDDLSLGVGEDGIR